MPQPVRQKVGVDAGWTEEEEEGGDGDTSEEDISDGVFE
jgi:hypothetical protein